jgi:ABC-type sugar transport system ATPase subunit
VKGLGRVRLEGIEKRYGMVSALKTVNLGIDRMSFRALGPSAPARRRRCA